MKPRQNFTEYSDSSSVRGKIDQTPENSKKTYFILFEKYQIRLHILFEYLKNLSDFGSF